MSANLALTGWDWFVLGALLISTALGLFSGMVRTVFALAGWVVAFLGAPLLAPTLLAATGWDLHPLFVMAILFFALLILVRLAGVLLARALARVGLGSVDRGLGAVLGVARALLIVAVAAVLGRAFGVDQDPAWTQAVSRPLLDELVSLADPLLPDRVKGTRI
ncbi:MAG: hypothetical protein GX644_09250 [Limnobacter sp.]|nr:hypothetical protein [Limnobacter sp.]